jgi:RNA polymerase sigma-70 factor (ECF subfamily)
MKDLKLKSDNELLEMAKNDPEIFGILMERYENQLFHFIRRIGQFQKEDIEDLLQEVFIKIYRKINEYEGELKFSSWIYRVAHNHVIDHFRKVGSRPQQNMLEDEEWEKLVSGNVSMEKELSNKDCVEKIKKCISAIPINYREVLVLRFVEDLEYEEIMDILKKPKGTVATLISRGKEALAKKMKENSVDCL